MLYQNLWSMVTYGKMYVKKSSQSKLFTKGLEYCLNDLL